MKQKRRLPAPPETGVLFDELLVLQAQRGDREAGERLYRRWNPRLMRAARRYGGSDDLAADLAQDCWLAIWKGLPGLRNPSRFRSYAFSVLHRRGASALRRTISERESPAEPQEASEPAPQSTGLILSQAFAQLPPDQRLAAHLHFVEGLTLREIADVQSVPEGTAKSRLFHARRKLKAALSQDSEGENP